MNLESEGNDKFATRNLKLIMALRGLGREGWLEFPERNLGERGRLGNAANREWNILSPKTKPKAEAYAYLSQLRAKVIK